MRQLSTLLLFGLLTSVNAQLRQSIDEQLLIDIVSKKQEEVKARVLGNLISKNIHTTNYTTYNTLYNLMDIILTEKNTTAMTDGIVRQAGDYAVTYAITDIFLRRKGNEIDWIINEGRLTPEEQKKNVEAEKERIAAKEEADRKAKKGGVKWVDPDTVPRTVRAADGFTRAMSIATAHASRPNQVDLTKFVAKGAINLKNSKGENRQLLVLNWVMDTIWGTLAKDTNFTKLGLFADDPRHPRIRNGLTKVDYSSFAKEDFGRTDSILARKVRDYIGSLSHALDTLQRAAATLGIKDAESLKDLNLEKLSALRPEQIKALFRLLSDAVAVFRDKIYQNAIVAQVVDIVSRYVITDMQEVDSEKYRYHFRIDVEAIILDLEDEFTRVKLSSLRHSLVGVKPFFSIGLNYGYFGRFDNTLDTQTQYGIESIGWAGEKAGLKFLFWDFGYTHSFRPGQWFRYRSAYRKWVNPPSKPVLYNIYASLWASGLIYTIADLRTDATLDHAIVGAGAGFQFFNGMDFNLSYAVPMIPNTSMQEKFDDHFWNLGFDIPIFEYLRAKKKGAD